MSRSQRVVFLPLTPGREIDGLPFDVADSVRIDDLLNKGWHITQITAAGERGGVYALIERDGPPRRSTIPVPGA